MGWVGLNFVGILLMLSSLLLGLISKLILEHLQEKPAVQRILSNVSEIIYSVHKTSVRRDRSVNAVYVVK